MNIKAIKRDISGISCADWLENLIDILNKIVQKHDLNYTLTKSGKVEYDFINKGVSIEGDLMLSIIFSDEPGEIVVHYPSLKKGEMVIASLECWLNSLKITDNYIDQSESV